MTDARVWKNFVGPCSLCCWMLSTFFSPGLGKVTERIVVGVPRLFGSEGPLPVVHWAVYAILFAWCVSQWRKLRQLRRQNADKNGR